MFGTGEVVNRTACENCDSGRNGQSHVGLPSRVADAADAVGRSGRPEASFVFISRCPEGSSRRLSGGHNGGEYLVSVVLFNNRNWAAADGAPEFFWDALLG